MKNLLSIVSFLLISSVAISQTPSEKVQAAFSAEKITELQENNPEKLEYWNFYAERVFVYNENRKPQNSYPDISTLEPKSDDTPHLTVDNFDPETFNPLLYKIDLKDKELQYFQVGENGGVVMIYSKLRFNVLYDRHQANNK